MTQPLPDPVAEARRREEAFLSGLARNIDELPHKLANPFGHFGSLKLDAERAMGLGWDQSAKIKPAMIAAGCFDRAVQARMPHGGAKLWSWRRHFWNRPREVAIAVVSLAPLADLAAGRAPSPAGPSQLAAVIEDIAARHDGGTVLLCMSPGGWEPDTYARLPRRRRVRLILIEPHGGGGWRILFDAVHSPAVESWMVVADPETRQQKIDRIHERLAAARADILIGGIEATAMAEQLNLPEGMVAAVFREAAAGDAHLRLHVEDRRLTLYHAPVDAESSGEDQEAEPMGLFQKLFGRAPDERKQIEVLSGRKSALVSRRDRLFSDVSALEAKEQKLLDEGAASENTTTRRRVAAQLSMVRKDIGRMQRLGNLLAQQIDIVSSQIGNLQLIVEGRSAKLPSEQELVDTAVAADAVIREVTETADQVRGLEEAMTGMSASTDEQEIFAEFDRRAEKMAEEKKTQAQEKPEITAGADRYEPVHPEPERERLVVELDEDKKEELEEGA